MSARLTVAYSAATEHHVRRCSALRIPSIRTRTLPPPISRSIATYGPFWFCISAPILRPWAYAIRKNISNRV